MKINSISSEDSHFADLLVFLTELPASPGVDISQHHSAPALQHPPAELPPKPPGSPGYQEVPVHSVSDGEEMVKILLVVFIFVQSNPTTDCNVHKQDSAL